MFIYDGRTTYGTTVTVRHGIGVLMLTLRILETILPLGCLGAWSCTSGACTSLPHISDLAEMGSGVGLGGSLAREEVAAETNDAYHYCEELRGR